MKTYAQIIDESRVQDARWLAGNVEDSFGPDNNTSFKKFQQMVDEITPSKTWQAHGMKTIKAAYLMYIDKWDPSLGVDNFKRLDTAI